MLKDAIRQASPCGGARDFEDAAVAEAIAGHTVIAVQFNLSRKSLSVNDESEHVMIVIVMIVITMA